MLGNMIQLDTQNRSALVEDGTLNPHAPQLPFPIVGSLNRIQRDSIPLKEKHSRNIRAKAKIGPNMVC